LIKHQRYAHAHQFKRANRSLRKQAELANLVAGFVGSAKPRQVLALRPGRRIQTGAQPTHFPPMGVRSSGAITGRPTASPHRILTQQPLSGD
jgi:hypothetical protein